MKQRWVRTKWAAIFVTLALTIATGSFAQEQPPAEATSYAEYWEQLRALYDLAKSAGDKVPADLSTWVQQDFQKMGTWEYKVVQLKGDATRLEEELDLLGADRWECIWIEGDGSSRRLVLKRPQRSWIGSVRWADFLKMIRGEDAGGP